MNQALIDNINEKVKKEDELWILGDVALNPAAVKYNIPKINCKSIYLVVGNHDRCFSMKEKWINLYKEWGFKEIYKGPIEKYFGKYRFVLNHYPENPLNGLCLCGHRHSKPENKRISDKMLDVGVDGNNYYPYSLQEIIGIFNEVS